MEAASCLVCLSVCGCSIEKFSVWMCLQGKKSATVQKGGDRGKRKVNGIPNERRKKRVQSIQLLKSWIGSLALMSLFHCFFFYEMKCTPHNNTFHKSCFQFNCWPPPLVPFSPLIARQKVSLLRVCLCVWVGTGTGGSAGEPVEREKERNNKSHCTMVGRSVLMVVVVDKKSECERVKWEKVRGQKKRRMKRRKKKKRKKAVQKKRVCPFSSDTGNESKREWTKLGKVLCGGCVQLCKCNHYVTVLGWQTQQKDTVLDRKKDLEWEHCWSSVQELCTPKAAPQFDSSWSNLWKKSRVSVCLSAVCALLFHCNKDRHRDSLPAAATEAQKSRTQPKSKPQRLSLNWPQTWCRKLVCAKLTVSSF